MNNVNVYSATFQNWLINFGPKFIGALILLIVGMFIINRAAHLIHVSLRKQKFEVSLQTFISSLFSIGLKIMLLIMVAGMIGIQTTSFVAVLGALGLAVGLALQGSLSNFAGGILILVFRPYKVGDRIESQGFSGAVIEIQIFNTVLLTPENKTIILANGAVSNNTVINLSKHGSLRVDFTITIEASNDIEKVRNVIIATCKLVPNVLDVPAPTVNVSKIVQDEIILAICPYTTAVHYWDVLFGAQEAVKIAFEQNGIELPEPSLAIKQASV